MSFQTFKEGCYQIREKRLEEKEIIKELRQLRKTEFEGVQCTVIDPSRERTSHRVDRDDKLINTIYEFDNKREILLDKFNKLPVVDEDIKNLLFNARGVGGLVVLQFFVFGDDLDRISRMVERSKDRCFKLLNDTLKQLYNEYEKSHKALL